MNTFLIFEFQIFSLRLKGTETLFMECQMGPQSYNL